MGIVKEDGDGWVYRYASKGDRFVLGQEGKRPLICFGVNPSTAIPKKLDRTLSRVCGVAKDKGYDGWIMLNLYPQRATKPKNMHVKFEQGEKIFENNLDQIREILFTYRKDIVVWAAWGTSIKKRDYLGQCLKEIVNVSPLSMKWVHMGELTKKGHPHHPLFLRKGLPFEDFDIKNYIRNL